MKTYSELSGSNHFSNAFFEEIRDYCHR